MLPCFVAAVLERREKAGAGAARGCRTQLLLETNTLSRTYLRGAEGGDPCGGAASAPAVSGAAEAVQGARMASSSRPAPLRAGSGSCAEPGAAARAQPWPAGLRVAMPLVHRRALKTGLMAHSNVSEQISCRYMKERRE